jgi:hypothetical protein
VEASQKLQFIKPNRRTGEESDIYPEAINELYENIEVKPHLPLINAIIMKINTSGLAAVWYKCVFAFEVARLSHQGQDGIPPDNITALYFIRCAQEYQERYSIRTNAISELYTLIMDVAPKEVEEALRSGRPTTRYLQRLLDPEEGMPDMIALQQKIVREKNPQQTYIPSESTPHPSPHPSPGLSSSDGSASDKEGMKL